jgi:hypothetical protein
MRAAAWKAFQSQISSLVFCSHHCSHADGKNGTQMEALGIHGKPKSRVEFNCCLICKQRVSRARGGPVDRDFGSAD